MTATRLQFLRLQGIRISQSTIPIGAIGWWGSTVGEIPSTLLQCNGSNGTPDVRNRFIIGAGNLYAVGAFAGSLTHTHAWAGGGGGSGLGVGTDLPNYTPTGSYSSGVNVSVPANTSSAGNNVPPYTAAPYVYHSVLSGIQNKEVVGWAGLIADIPAGFSLCNGQTVNGITTPDWRDKFIVASGDTYAQGDTGGATTHTHPNKSLGFGSGALSAGVNLSVGGVPPASYSHNFSWDGISYSSAVASIPPTYALCFIQNTSGTILPVYKGIIMIWANSIASIPSDWAINNSLKDKIPVGAGTTYTSGTAYGATTHNSTPGYSGTWGLQGSGNLYTGAPQVYKATGTWAGGGPASSGTNLPPSVAYAYITKL